MRFKERVEYTLYSVGDTLDRVVDYTLENTLYRLQPTLIALAQRLGLFQHTLVNERGDTIPIYYIERDGRLMAFFPGAKTEFDKPIIGGDELSLANAHLLGFVNVGDTLLVRYVSQPDFFKVRYLMYKGYYNRVRHFGDRYLHALEPVELEPGVRYGDRITFWKKVDVTSPQA